MNIRRPRTQRDVQELTGRRGPKEKRAVRWDELDNLAITIAAKLAGTTFGKAITPYLDGVTDLDEAALDTYLADANTIAQIEQTIDSTNTYIDNLVGTYTGTLPGIRDEIDKARDDASADLSSARTTLETEVQQARDDASADLSSARTALETDIQQARDVASTDLSNARNALENDIDTVQSQVNDLQNLPAWDSTTSYAVDDQVTYNGSLYVAIQASTNVAPTDTAYWDKVGEYATLGDAVASHSNSIGDLNDDITSLSATLTNDYYTLSQTDSAISAATTTLKAEIEDPNGASLGATLNSEQVARADADSALAADIQTVSSRVGYAEGDIVDARIVSAADHVVSVAENVTLSASLGDAEAEIDIERIARVDGDTALASDITTISSRVDTAEADISQEAITRASEDDALASRLTTVETSTGDNASAITAEETARSDEDVALAGRIDTVGATANTNEADITAEQVARADADSALAADISTVLAVADSRNRVFEQASPPAAPVVGDLWFKTDDNNRPRRWSGAAWAIVDDTRVGQNAADITTEQTARADADTALASDISTVSSRVDTAEADITSEQIARSDADSALASEVNTLESEIEGVSADLANNYYTLVQTDSAISATTTTLKTEIEDPNGTSVAADLESEKTTRANADSAIAGDVSSLTTRMDTAEADITSEQIARADADTALASDVNSLTARVDTAEADITTEQTARADGDSAIASDVTSLTTRVDTAEADITAEQIARSDADSALTSEITTLSSRVDTAEADITSEQLARSDADTALASDIDTVSADLSAAEADVTTNAAAIATIEGFQAATYTLRVDAGDAQGSLEMVAADDPINGPASAVRMRADNILLDGTVRTPHLRAGAVTAGIIGANAVTANKIDANAVTADKIDAGAITAVKIGANEVTADKVKIDNGFLDTAGDGSLTFKAGGVTSEILTANAATKTEANTAPESGMGDLVTVTIDTLGSLPLLVLASFTIKNDNTPSGSSSVLVSCEVDGSTIWSTLNFRPVSLSTSSSGSTTVKLSATDTNAIGTPTVDDIELVILELRR